MSGIYNRKSAKTVSLFLIIMLVLSMMLPNAEIILAQSSGDFAGGSGTEADPYRVATTNDLHKVRNYPNAHFIQESHIDISGFLNEDESWEPIGSADNPFTGTYDGGGYRTENLFIDAPNLDGAGLFGYTGEGAELKNINLHDVNVSGRNFVGGLAGYVYCTGIKNIDITGEVSGGNNTGGLVGYAEGTTELKGSITGSRADVEVTGFGNKAGGLVGYAIRSDISESSAYGDITRGGGHTGGLAGDYRYGNITDSYAKGAVRGGGHYAGGLVGYARTGNFINSFATGDVYGSGNYAGGLVGCGIENFISGCHATGSVSGSMYTGGLLGHGTYTEIAECYATGFVEGRSHSAGGLAGILTGGGSRITESFSAGDVEGGGNRTGGLVGDNSNEIINSYARGSVTGYGDQTGGLAGRNSGIIFNCYAAGNITGDGDQTGGLVGRNDDTVINSYYDRDAAGQDDEVKGLPRSTAFMQYSAPSDYIYTNWDTEKWCFRPVNRYPILKWTTEAVIESFDFDNADKTGPALIDNTAKTVYIEVAYGTDLTHLTAEFALTEEFTAFVGDTEQISGASSNNFSDPVIYTIVSPDGAETDWEVTVTLAPGDRAGILSFSLPGEVVPAVINPVDYTVEVTMFEDADLTDLAADFELTFGATAEVDGETQISGETTNNFSSPVVYTVIAPDEITEVAWTVNVTEVPPLFAGGEGTADDPYIVTTAANLNNVRDFPDAHFIQAAHIDLSDFPHPGESWAPLGNRVFPFTGTYDGDGFDIANLTVDSPDLNYAGLFGYCGEEAVLKNIGLTDVDINANNFLGGLAGYTGEGTEITGITVGEVSINGHDYLGGLVGYNNRGTITDSHINNAEVTGNRYTGGLAGYCNRVTVSECRIEEADINGGRYTGGLLGYSERGAITGAHVMAGHVSGEDDTGGLAGIIDGAEFLTDSYAGADVTGTGNRIGGLAGYIKNSEITGCQATGSVTGDSNITGGLAGYADSSTFYASSASGDVSGAGSRVGGLLGHARGGNIVRCSAAGSLRGGGSETGGLVGLSVSVNITESYATGDVTGDSSYLNGKSSFVGGLVGYASGGGRFTINAGFATGEVELTGGGSGTGGLAGYSNITIADSYAVGDVTGDGDNTGGLAGENRGIVINSYAVGEVSGSGDHTGGLVGINSNTVENSYYDRETTGMNDDNGKGMPRPTREMQFLNTNPDSIYTNWDTEIWRFSPVNRYPILKWTTEAVIKSFGFVDADKTGPAVIDNTAKTVDIEVAYGTDLTEELTAFFDLKEGYTAWVGVDEQVSGTTPNNFSGPVTYTIVCPDETETDWEVTVTVASGDGADILFFSLPHEVVPAVINPVDYTVEVTMFEDADLTDLAADFELTFGATAEVGGEPQTAGETANDFDLSSSVEYTVIAPDETTEVVWTVGVTGVPPLFSGGEGTADDPYIVATPANLNNVRDFPGDHFKQAAHIDISDFPQPGDNWVPVGTAEMPFTGTYDGDGYRIKNLIIDDSGLDYAGLFGYAGEGAELKNIYLSDVNVSGRNFVGSLVGYSYRGLITGINTTGEVNGNRDVGGLAGYLEGTSAERGHITGSFAGTEVTGTGGRTGGLVGYSVFVDISDCSSGGSVTGTGNTGGLIGYSVNSNVMSSHAAGTVHAMGNAAGGLVGYDNQGSITESYATGDVTGAGNTGGLVGYINRGSVSECHATGSVDAMGNAAGGLAGYALRSSIAKSYATGDVTGAGNSVGGLAGYATGKISESCATGSVTGDGTGVGGLTGFSSNEIADSYATGSVTGNGDNTGGLTGENRGRIVNSYATGPVGGAGIYTGGLAGRNLNTVLDSYYDLITTGRSDMGKGIPRNTEEMQFGVPSQYIYTNWDENIWRFTPAGRYPILKWTSETHILSFGFPEETGPAVIDRITQMVEVEVAYGTDLTELTAEFALTDGFTACVGVTEQISGTTSNDFSDPDDPVIYTIVSPDGVEADWKVTVTESPGDGADILSFSFGEADVTVETERHIKIIRAVVDYGTDLTDLVAFFELSSGAEAEVNGEPQVSGETPNDFSEAVNYKIIPVNKNEDDIQNWTVLVGKPALSIEKKGPPVASEGGTVTFEYKISNTGQLDLSGVEVTDTMISDTWVHTIGDLVVDESHTIEKEYSVPADKAGKTITGTATVKGSYNDRQVSDSDEYSMVIPMAPKITASPASRTVNEGGSAVFSVSATGSVPLEYQWERSDDNGNTWSDITGATGLRYTTPPLTYAHDDGALFRCTVTNEFGSTVSGEARLTVMAGLREIHIISNPAEGGTVMGAGTYVRGTRLTVSAVANDGYSFVNWTEGGSAVSSDASFNFEVLEHRVLLANFKKDDPDEDKPDRVSGVVLDKNRLTLAPGETATLSATISPDTAANKNLEWSSDNEAVATASQNGEVKAVDEGTAVITVKTEDGGYTDTCLVEVKTEEILHTLTYTAGNNGRLEGQTRQNVPGGADGTAVKAVPHEGYRFVKWSDGVTANPRTDRNITGDISVTAEFDIAFYDVRLYANPAEGGTVTGADSYAYGTEVTITATANEGYSFVNWTENGEAIDTGKSFKFTVKKHRVLLANFKKDDPDEDDPDRVSGVVLNKHILSLAPGETAALSAVVSPDTAGNKNVTWSSDNTAVATVSQAGRVSAVSGGRAVITVKTEDGGYIDTCAVTVKPSELFFTLTYTAGKNGTIKGETPQSVEYGHEGTAVEAVPDTGYFFVRWSDGSTDNPRTDRNITSDISVTAEFDVDFYNIRLHANPTGGGTVTGGGDYAYGTEVTIKASASDGYSFVNWTEGGKVVGSDTAFTFEVKEDRVFIANFRYDHQDKTFFTLTYTAGDNGTIEGETSQKIAGGDNGTAVRAVPDEGYRFVKWSDGIKANPRTDRNVAGDISVTAEFEIAFYDIRLYANPTGGGMVTGGGEYAYGTEVTIKASANDGYSFVNWTEGGKVVGSAPAFTFEVKEDRVFIANFRDDHLDKDDPDRVSRVVLNKHNLSLALGETAQLSAHVYPETAANKNVTWSSDNTAVATVTRDGVVKAAGEGTAAVIVMTEDGGYIDTCVVTVKPAEFVSPVPIEEVNLNYSTFTWYVGITDQLVLIPQIEPSGAEGLKLFWSSDDESMAIVDQDLSGNGAVTTSLITGMTAINLAVQQGNDVITRKCIINVVKYGDVSGDGEIEVRDAILILRHIVGLEKLETPYRKAADVSRDGKVDVSDAILVLRHIVGLIIL